MSIHSIHHDRSLCDEPEVFRPERFIDKDGKLINSLLDDMRFFGSGNLLIFYNLYNCFILFVT